MSTNIFRPIFLNNLQQTSPPDSPFIHKLRRTKTSDPKNKLFNLQNAIKIFEKVHALEIKPVEKESTQQEEVNGRHSKTFYESSILGGEKKIILDNFRGKKLVQIPQNSLLKYKKGWNTDHTHHNQSLRLFSTSKHKMKQAEKHYEHLSISIKHQRIENKRRKKLAQPDRTNPKKENVTIAIECKKGRPFISSILSQRHKNANGQQKIAQNNYKTVSSHEDSILIHKFR